MTGSGKRPRETPGPGESIPQTVRQLVRGIAGGMLLGLPPLFTMEMWVHGALLDSWKIAVLIAFTFALVVGYSAFSGFRHERTWPDLLLDSVAAMGIAARRTHSAIRDRMRHVFLARDTQLARVIPLRR